MEDFWAASEVAHGSWAAYNHEELVAVEPGNNPLLFFEKFTIVTAVEQPQTTRQYNFEYFFIFRENTINLIILLVT